MGGIRKRYEKKSYLENAIKGENMSIKSIKVLNVMAFQRQWRLNNGDCNSFRAKPGDRISDAFGLQFCDGINILIGENGVGKTTILKIFSPII